MYSESLAQSYRRESTICQSSDLFRRGNIIYGYGHKVTVANLFHSWSKRFLALAIGRPFTLLDMGRWAHNSLSMCTSPSMPRHSRFQTLWCWRGVDRHSSGTTWRYELRRWSIRGYVFVPPKTITLKIYASNSTNACILHLFGCVTSRYNNAHPSNRQRRIALYNVDILFPNPLLSILLCYRQRRIALQSLAPYCFHCRGTTALIPQQTAHSF